MSQSRILFLSRWFPYPYDNGAKIRVFHLIKELAKDSVVDLVSFASEEPAEEHLHLLNRICGNILYQEYKPFKQNDIKAIAGFLSPKPRAVVSTRSQEFQQKVDFLVSRNSYDVVIASQIDMAPYALHLEIPMKILEELELTVLYEQFINQRNSWVRFRNWLTWIKLSRYIRHLFNIYSGCTVVSMGERDIARQLAKPGYPICIIPNGVDVNIIENGKCRPIPDTLIFSGALTYGANFQAAKFFLSEIFPLILTEVPNAKFIITGSLKGVDVESLPKLPGVEFTGYVEDIHRIISESWVSIVPLQIGGGTRLKILEAMALGTPVVSTSKGAEGLSLENGKDLIIADHPKDFALSVLNLLRNPEGRERISQHGRQTVVELYNWEKIGLEYRAYLEGLRMKNQKHVSSGTA